MSAHPKLNPIADPFSLGKLNILLIPVHLSSNSDSPGSTLTEGVYEHWTTLIKRHTVLRGDEIRQYPPSSKPSSFRHGRGAGPSDPRARFFPVSSGQSVSRNSSSTHVHLAYPSHPPARHLSPLSLLRMAGSPLVVIGIAVDDGDMEGEEVKGYSLDQGDIGQVASSSSSRLPRIKTTRSFADAFDDSIQSLIPPTSAFPMVKRLILVPPHIPRSPNANSPMKNGHLSERNRNDSRNVASQSRNVVYAPGQGIDNWLSRIMGEVVGEVLGELGELASSLETPDGLHTLSATLLPTLSSDTSDQKPIALSASPANDQSQLGNGRPPPTDSPSSSTAPSGIKRSLTPGGRPTSVQPASLPPIQTNSVSPAPPPVASSSNPFRRSTALTSPFSRTSSSTSALSTISNGSTTTLSASSKYTSAPLAGVAGGRLLKLLGDMYLLAGMHVDAIKCYEDGAERCRGVGDVLWESSAREGRAVAGIGEAWESRDGSNTSAPFPNSPIPVEILTHFLSALSCLSRSPLPFPPTILSPSPQALSGSIAFASSAPNLTRPGTGEGLLAYLYSNLCLRISHFMLLIFSAGGWGAISLSCLVGHHLPRSLPIFSLDSEKEETNRRRRLKTLQTLAASSQISRRSVIGHAEGALGPWHKALNPVEQVALHVEAVWLARWLGLERKEGRYSREVVKRLGAMVVDGREENRRLGIGTSQKGSKPAVPTAEATLSEAGGNELQVGLGLGMPANAPNQQIAIRRKESVEGNAGIISLFERACEIAGIRLMHLQHETVDEGWRSEKEQRFGWPELQVEMMKEGIAVAEALPDHSAVIRLSISALRNLNPFLNPISQTHLSKMYPQALAIVRRRGINIGSMPWWLPGKIVLSLEIASLAANKIPMEHAREEIVQSQNVAGSARDPFLYNPRLKVASDSKTVIVAQEQVDIFVTVQNPFAFDLEIQDMSLITSGVSFATVPLPLTIPSASIQTVRLSGLASSAGSLSIRGVSLRLKDGSSTDILLPVLDNQGKASRDKRKSRLQAEISKVKRTGLEARDAKDDTNGWRDSQGDVQQQWLDCTVVEEQPLLWIKKTSLTHGTVMLYSGETSFLRLTVENSSSVPIDFVKVTFEDSTTREAQAVIAEGELTPEQAFEIEGDMLNRPVFVWEDGVAGANCSIASGGRRTLTIRCLGKIGCTDGTVRINYGYINRSQSEGSSELHTRQITFPVLFTVYHTLDCSMLDLMRTSAPTESFRSSDGIRGNPPDSTAISNGRPNPSDMASSPEHHKSPEEMLRLALYEEQGGNYCLVAVDVRNVYGVPFEVVLSRKDEHDHKDLFAIRLVPPGATERIILPLKRMDLPPSVLSQPVPSISERQYLIDKQRKSVSRAQLDRDLFWYREELLKIISATWREPGSKRYGDLSLRAHNLTPTMLDVLRVDNIAVDISIVAVEQDVAKAGGAAAIVTTITNNLDRPFRPFIRLEPLPSSATEKSWTVPAPLPRRPQSNQPLPPSHIRNIIFDGVLTRILPDLQPGESQSMKVIAWFLSSGEFAFRAAVEEITLDQPGGGISDHSEIPLVRFSEVSIIRIER